MPIQKIIKKNSKIYNLDLFHTNYKVQIKIQDTLEPFNVHDAIAENSQFSFVEINKSPYITFNVNNNGKLNDCI